MPTLTSDEVALLMKLPHTVAAVPFDKRRLGPELRALMPRVDALKSWGLLKREIEPTGQGFFKMHLFITPEGAAACAQARGG